MAVEPDAANAAMVRKNFELNDVPGCVIDAAIGPVDGTATFEASHASNAGHVIRTDSIADGSVTVRMISMHTVLKRLSTDQRIDLLKIDIEGGEEALFSGDLSWLARVESIIIELHPDRVDSASIISCVVSQGFEYVPSGSIFAHSMDAFIRKRT